MLFTHEHEQLRQTILCFIGAKITPDVEHRKAANSGLGSTTQRASPLRAWRKSCPESCR